MSKRKNRITEQNSLRFEAGESVTRFLDEAAKYKPLSREEEQELAVLCQQGDREAINKLVKHNLLFLVKPAMAYATNHLPAEDLLSEAVLGMYAAAERFKPIGIKFVSYAVWYIRIYLQKYQTNKGRAVRLPYSFAELEAVIKGYDNKFGDVEHAEPAHIRKAMKKEHRGPISNTALAYAKTSIIPHKSLNAPLNNDINSEEFQDLLVGELSSPDDFIGPHSARAALDIAMGCLDERRRRIIEHYYLDDEQTNMNSLARELGCSRQRVFQLKTDAMKKLKAGHNNLLADALGEEKYKVWWNES